MESSWKKPESKMAKPKPQMPAEAEEAVENQEILAAQQRKSQQEKEHQDKIGELLGGNWFITNWTTPILAHPTLAQMTVSRFYPEVFVAVDVFIHLGEWEKKIIEYKREQFRNNMVEHGGRKGKVRYGALSYADSLSALAPQLEE